jgi:hypothetical protein
LDISTDFGKEFLAPCPSSKLEYHSLSAVRDSMFNISTSSHHVCRPSPPPTTGRTLHVYALRLLHEVICTYPRLALKLPCAEALVFLHKTPQGRTLQDVQ